MTRLSLGEVAKGDPIGVPSLQKSIKVSLICFEERFVKITKLKNINITNLNLVRLEDKSNPPLKVKKIH